MSTEVQIPDPDGPRTVVSVGVERQSDGVALYVLETRTGDLSHLRTVVPLSWADARSLFHNLANLLTSEMAVREMSEEDGG